MKNVAVAPPPPLILAMQNETSTDFEVWHLYKDFVLFCFKFLLTNFIKLFSFHKAF